MINDYVVAGTGDPEGKLPDRVLVHSIAADSAGRLYVADRSNARVQVFDSTGRFLAEWRDVIVPWGIWITSSDEIWVCGSSPMQRQEGQKMGGIPPKDQLFMRFDPDGRVRQIWTLDHPPAGGEPEAGTTASRKCGQVSWIHGIALDSKGNAYLGDIKGKRFQKFVKHLDPRAWLA